MERDYWNDSEVMSAADSWVYQYEDPQYYNLQNEPSNHTGSVQYFRSNLNCHPIQYGPMPVFHHPKGYVINTHPFYNHDLRNGTIFLPYGSQFHNFRQPMFHRNPIWFQDGLHAAKNFWDRRVAATYFRGQHIHRPESVVDDSLWFSSGDNIYERNQSTGHTIRIDTQNEGHPFSRRNTPTKAKFSTFNWDTVNGYSLPVCTNGWDWNLIDDRNTQNTYHRANLTQSKYFPMVHSFLHQNISLSEDYSLSKGSNGDTGFISEATYRDFESDTATETFGLGQDVIPFKENTGSVKMGSSNDSDGTISIEQNYSQHQPGYNSVGTNPTKSSVVSSTLRTLGSTHREKQRGSRGNTRCNKLIQSIRYRAPRIRVGNRKASVPRLVWLKKIKAQAAAIRSERSRSNSLIHHITWNAFDEESEPTGQKCLLCDHDLLYAPTDDGYEYFDAVIYEHPKLSDVAVLSCGHVFHSQCLELATPEDQSTDPPCFICLSCAQS